MFFRSFFTSFLLASIYPESHSLRPGGAPSCGPPPVLGSFRRGASGDPRPPPLRSAPVLANLPCWLVTGRCGSGRPEGRGPIVPSQSPPSETYSNTPSPKHKTQQPNTKKLHQSPPKRFFQHSSFTISKAPVGYVTQTQPTLSGGRSCGAVIDITHPQIQHGASKIDEQNNTRKGNETQ